MHSPRSFAFVLRDSLYCFGQRVVLTDGSLPSITYSPRWNLFSSSSDWVHFAFTVDPELQTCSARVNGELFVQVSVLGRTSVPALGTLSPLQRLTLGQLARGNTRITETRSFQGSIDELRLWAGKRFDGTDPPGPTQMHRALLRREYVPGTLLAYWDFDVEPLATLNGTNVQVFDRLGKVNGTLNQLCPSCGLRNPAISLGPSDAPLISYAAPWIFHITKSGDSSLGPFSWICLDNDTLRNISCATTTYTLDSLTVTSQSASGLTKPAQGYNSTSSNITYLPFLFLFRSSDSFTWSVSSTSTGTLVAGALIRLYSPPAESMYSPYNITNVRAALTVNAGSAPSVIRLPCFSLVGAKPKPFILSAPASSKLFQVQTTLASNGTYTTSSSNDQMLSCGSYASNYPYVSDECYVQSDSQSVYYVPMADSSLGIPSDLYINYSCGMPDQDIMMNPLVVNLVAQSAKLDDQLTFDASLVGPNPFALSFDGAYTHVVSSIGKALDIVAVSVWVRPDLNPVYDANSTTYSETRTVLQLFPMSVGYTHQTEVLLVRNASSYPNYFTVVRNYNTLDTSISTNTYYTLSSFGTSTSTVWIPPNQWTNILITQSPSASSNSQLYLDGSPITIGPFGSISSPFEVHLGAAAQYTPSVRNMSYTGLIDDVSLWSSPFTPYDALSLQLEAIAEAATGLEAYWDLDEGVGFVATDSVNNYTLLPSLDTSDTNASTLSQAQAMPSWTWPIDLTFDSISTSITTPQLITLSAYAGSPADSWKLGVYITNLPSKGTLYQVPANLTITDSSGFSIDDAAFWLSKKQGKVARNEFLFGASLQSDKRATTVNLSDPAFIETLTPISAPYNGASDVTLYYMWASAVFDVSSSRNSPTGSSWWNASNILGAPSWWQTPSNGSSSNSSKREDFDFSDDSELNTSLDAEDDADADAEIDGDEETQVEAHSDFDAWFQSQKDQNREQGGRWVKPFEKLQHEALVVEKPRPHKEKPHHGWKDPKHMPRPLHPFPLAQPGSEPASPSRDSREIYATSFPTKRGATTGELVSQNSPVYGENPLSWSPASSCDGLGADLEYIVLQFEEELYIRRVEIFQNLLSGAVTRISMWDSTHSAWRDLYSGVASPPKVAYTTFTPAISAFVAFKSDRLRIELDTCTYLGWYEIEAVRVTGTKSLPDGVVSDPQSRVIFVPSTPVATTDSLTYSASTDPLSLSTASPSFSYNLDIGHVTSAPVVYSETLDVQARDFTLVHLLATTSDTSVSSIQRVISKLPDVGTLFNAEQGRDGGYHPTNELGPSSTDIIISNSDGFVFYRAPDACKYKFSGFNYYATSNGQTSSTATITLNSLCPPSFLNYQRWLSVILLVLVILAIIAAGLFGLYALAERKQRAIECDRHQILVAISIAAMISYASLFFEFAPVTVGWCVGKLWVLHLGTTMLVASALALILVRWTDFSSQTLRSANRNSSSIPMSALILGGLALLIEVVQLIIFTSVDRPEVKVITSKDNSAASFAMCSAPRFPYTLLVINKAVWLVAVFVIACILLSVSTNGRSNYTFILFSSIVGIVSGLAFIIALYSTHSPAVMLTLNVLALVVPISLFIGALFLSHIVYRKTNKIQNVVETTEFGLQPITSQKGTARNKANPQITDTVANVQMTIDMNNHSVDKSVASLLDTVQMKEREIAHLKRKLLKRHYKIRELQQKLTETNESSNMQLFGSVAPDYTE